MNRPDLLSSDAVSGAEAVVEAAPVFILSPGHREELYALALDAGWKPLAARRRERAESRYLGSLARTALVDVRGHDDDAAKALIRSLADAVEASGGAMLLLIDPAQERAVPEFVAAGATHFVVAPITRERLAAGLASADALAGRLIGSLATIRNRHAVQRRDSLFWRWSSVDRVLSASPALVALATEMDPQFSLQRATVSRLVRLLHRSERAGAVAALRHAIDDLMPAAFAHGIGAESNRRFVQHIYPDSNGFSGETELLDASRRADSRDTDFLTGLANRRGALAWTADALAKGGQVTLLLVGLNGFDRVNTAYGRIVGDAMLTRIALRLSRLAANASGEEPLVARIAGAEFLVGLRKGGTSPERDRVEKAGLLASHLVSGVERPFNGGDHLIRVSARCGIAVSGDRDSEEAMLRRASSALADARRGGAGGSVRVRFADGASHVVHRDRIDSDLRHALDRDEIQVLFQPQFAMADDRITGVEALARWQHPVHGEIGAGALFAIAERSDFLVPLSDHIHARALAIAAQWPAALSDLRIALNVTAADIGQPDVLEKILEQIDNAGIERRRITVEITESGLIENLGQAAALLTRLRSERLAVAIDDFGTGYSSLAYLKALPLDYLKIDSTIAQDIAGSQRDRVIVRGIIDMARSLGLNVIAEGVETEQQLVLLARAGCDSYQGFLRSPPLDGDALVQFVTSGG